MLLYITSPNHYNNSRGEWNQPIVGVSTFPEARVYSILRLGEKGEGAGEALP